MTRNDIREKTRAVFLAALMVLSVVAMSATFAGAAAAQADEGESELTGFSIVEGESTSERTLLDDATGLDGVDSSITQEHELTLDMNATDTAEVEVDASESVDANVNITSANIVESANFTVSDAEVGDDGIITFNVTSDDDVEQTIGVELELDGSDHTVSDTARISHTASVTVDGEDAGESRVARYRIVERGTATADATANDTVEDGADVEFGEVADTVTVFNGEVITVGAADEGDQVGIYEFTTNGGLDRAASAEVRRGTAPGSATNLDTTGLEAGEYLIQVNETEAGVNNSYVWLEVDALNLGADFAQENFTTNEEVEVDVSSDDLSGENDVNVTLYEDEVADGNEVATVSETLDATDGNATVAFDPQDTGDYVAVAEHDSGVTAETGTTSVVEAPEVEVDAQFTETPFEEERGDIVEITVDLQDTDRANVTIGNEEELGYEAVVQVTTDNVGDEVTIGWNTFSAGDGADDAFVVADEDHSIEVLSQETDLEGGANDSIIQAGAYDAFVQPLSDETDVLDTDATLVVLNERSTDNVTTWTATLDNAVSAAAQDDPVAAIGDAVENELIVESGQVAEGDVLISEVEASGLEGVLAAQDGPSDTEAFIQAVNEGYMSLEFTQQDAGVNREPITFEIDEDVSEVLTVVPDGDNDRYFVVLAIDSLNADGALDFPRDVESGTTFDGEFTVDAGEDLESFRYGLVAPDEDGDFDDEVVEYNWTAVDRDIDVNIEGDELVVSPAGGQQINGTTTVAPGTELRFRITSTEAENPFIIPGLETEVTATNASEDNAWSVEANFSQATAGDEFDFVYRGEFASKDPVPGVVADLEEPFYQVSELNPEEATIEPGDNLTVSANVTNVGGGGANASKDVELRLDGDTLATEGNVSLDSGESTTVEFNVPGADTEELSGEFEHSVWTEDSEANGTLTVGSAESTFELTLDDGPSEVEPGASISVDVTVENTGGAEGTQDITFTFDGEEAGSSEVTLAGGESQSVTFDATAPDAEGDYDWEIASEDDSISQTLTVAAATDDGGADDNATDGGDSADDGGAGFGVAAALIALLGAALLAYRRRAE